MESHYKQSGELPEQLDVPPIPYELQYIWDWWTVLSESRPVGMDAGHINFTEIANWSKLLKINVTEFEVRCIMALDSAFLACRREQQAKKVKADK